jgi:hypothetical protein
MHPLARGLVFAWAPCFSQLDPDLVTGRPGYRTDWGSGTFDPKRSHPVYGLGMATWNFSLRYASCPGLWNATGDLTLWLVGANFTGNNMGGLLGRSWGAYNEYALYVDGSDTLSYCRDGPGHALSDSSGAIPGTSGAFHSFCATHIGTTVQFYIDGAARGNGTVAQYTAGSTEPMDVGDSDATNGQGSLAFLAFVWMRGLSPAEVLSLETEALALIARPPARFLNYVTVAGGTFKPAWAAQASLLVGGGLHV